MRRCWLESRSRGAQWGLGLRVGVAAEQEAAADAAGEFGVMMGRKSSVCDTTKALELPN